MTQEFVTLPRHVAEHAVTSIEMLNAGKWTQVTALAATLRTALEQPQGEQELVGEHELKDVRCECCGYMTHHREHMGCIRAAQPKREPLPPQADTPLTQEQLTVFKYGWKCAEAAHSIK